VRLVNVVSGDIEWLTVAYVPVVQKLQEPSASDKARDRRCGVLQRVLFLAFREVIQASRDGLELPERWKDEALWAFPRVLLYVCDQPEERAVLCLKPGICAYPCSLCTVEKGIAGAPMALRSVDRVVVRTLERQVEAATHLATSTNRQRRIHLESLDSTNSFVPVLAAMSGLSTPPHLLYRMIGFDALHVSFSSIHHDACAAIPASERFPLLPNATAYFRLTPMIFCAPFFFLCLAVDTRRSPSPQVLDLGVTRTLVHRLVRIFPYICKGHHPLMGSFAATYRIANHRLEHMGRRSKARKLAPGYVSVDCRDCDCDAFLYMFSIAWGARR